MKKGLTAMLTMAAMAFNVSCFASSNSDILESEQKIANSFIDAVQVDTIGDLPKYDKFSENFSEGLKGKITPHIYEKLHYQIEEQYGKLNNVKFYNYISFDDLDRIKYVGNFTKEKAVSIEFTFNKDNQLAAFTFIPLTDNQLTDNELGSIGSANEKSKKPAKVEKQIKEKPVQQEKIKETKPTENISVTDSEKIKKLKRMKAEIAAQKARNAQMLEDMNNK